MQCCVLCYMPFLYFLYLCVRACVCVYSCVVMQAAALGSSSKTVEEYLEKHYTEEVLSDDESVIRLAIRALLEASSF